MQQRVSSVRRAPPRTQPAGGSGQGTAPVARRRRASTPARIFYLLRWTYHFITPLGMLIILWGVYEAGFGDKDIAWPLIVGGGIFTYCANYFNKAR